MKGGNMTKYNSPFSTLQPAVIKDSLGNFVYVIAVSFPPSTKLYNFLVDTGSPTVITPQVSQELGIKSLHNFTDYTFENHPSFVVGMVPTLQINQLQWENIGVVIDTLPQGFDGIIGANLMQHALWQFFPQEQKIIIYDYAKKQLQPNLQGYTSIDLMKTVFRVPKFYGFINNFNQKQVFCLSTGFAGGIKIPAADFQRRKQLEIITTSPITDTKQPNNLHSLEKWQSYLIEKEKIKNENGAIVYATNTAMIYTFRTVSLQTENIAAIFSEGNTWQIGNNFLRNYMLVVDWQQRKFYLKPYTK
jgi:hypothetical protein